MPRLPLPAFAAISLAFAPFAKADLRYDVIDIGALAGNSCSASALNNSGEVVGSYYTGRNGNWRAFHYVAGKFTDLGTFGGTSSYAVDINDVGQIVGKAMDSGSAYHVFLTTNGVMQDLGTMNGGWPQALNNSGDFIGFMPVGNEYHPFLYQAGTVTDLASAIGGTNTVDVSGINDSGAIVGSMKVGQYNHAFVYYGGTTTDLAVQLSLPADSITHATAINNSGQILFAGQLAGYGDKYQPFLYSGGTYTNLDPNHDPSGATDINSSGRIIGDFLFEYRDHSAYLIENGAPLRLKNVTSPTLPYRLYYATAINDSGWILCNDDNSSYLLIPIDPGIPQPSLAPIAKKRIVVSRPRLVLTGRARGKVTSISFRVGTRACKIATGTNKWHIAVSLKGLKRTSLSIFAHGPGGDSTPIRIPVVVK